MHSRVATPEDAAAIATIYNEGIEDRVATFETEARTAAMVQTWFDGLHPIVVVEQNEEVIAYASSSSYRPRACYAGIVEFSVYVRRSWRGKGSGRLALSRLIQQCEVGGFSKLVSRVFIENTASRALLQALGFREVGVYEKHGQLDGIWRDVVIVEYLLPSSQAAAHTGERATLSTGPQESGITFRLEAAQTTDLPAMLALLTRTALPQAGLAQVLSTTIVAREAGQIIGCAALEVHGTAALLRSVAVDPAHRSRSLGKQLLQERLQEARKLGVQEIYLLTETAHNYFVRLGFRPVERATVPSAITRSIEWTSACSTSASVLVLQLTGS